MIKTILYHLGLDRRDDQYPFYKIGRRDVIMVHISKTAGTSIRNTLGMYPADATKGIAYKQHLTAQEIIDVIGRETWDRAFSFAVVRNPWDRMVSEYFYRKKHKDFEGNDWDISFEHYIKGSFGLESLPYDPPHKFIMPQRQWLIDEENKLCVEYIARYESLEADFRKIVHRVNSPSVRLKNHNTGARKRDYTSYYTDELIELVGHYYKEDTEEFGYEFT